MKPTRRGMTRIVVLAFLVALGTGLAGFLLAPKVAVHEAIYETAKLFTVNYDRPTEASGFTVLLLDIARFAALVAIAGTVLGLAASWLADRADAVRIYRNFWFGQTLIIGLGGKSWPIVEAAIRKENRGWFGCRRLARRRRVVILERDPGNPTIAKARKEGAIVRIGDARDQDVLEDAGLAWSTRVIGLADEVTNRQVGDVILELVQQRLVRARHGLGRLARLLLPIVRLPFRIKVDPETGSLPQRMTVYLHIGSYDDWDGLAVQDFLKPGVGPVRINWFNRWDMLGGRVVRQLLEDQAATSGRPDRGEHVVVYGDGAAAQYLAVAVVRHGYRSIQNLTVTLIGDEAGKKCAHARSHLLSSAVPAGTLTSWPTTDRNLGRCLREFVDRTGRLRPPVTQILICPRSEDAPSAWVTLVVDMLGQGLDPERICLVRRDRERGLVDGWEQRHTSLLTRPFKTLDSSYKVYENFEERLPKGEMAQIQHDVWIDSRLERDRSQKDQSKIDRSGLDQLWMEDQGPGYRESSMEAVLRLRENFAQLNLGLRRKRSNVLKARSEWLPVNHDWAIEVLARYEHERWLKARQDSGWKYGPKRDDQKREHPDIQPWLELEPEVREQNRSLVRGQLSAFEWISLGLTPYGRDPVETYELIGELLDQGASSGQDSDLKKVIDLVERSKPGSKLLETVLAESCRGRCGRSSGGLPLTAQKLLWLAIDPEGQKRMRGEATGVGASLAGWETEITSLSQPEGGDNSGETSVKDALLIGKPDPAIDAFNRMQSDHEIGWSLARIWVTSPEIKQPVTGKGRLAFSPESGGLIWVGLPGGVAPSVNPVDAALDFWLRHRQAWFRTGSGLNGSKRDELRFTCDEVRVVLLNSEPASFLAARICSALGARVAYLDGAIPDGHEPRPDWIRLKKGRFMMAAFLSSAKRPGTERNLSNGEKTLVARSIHTAYMKTAIFRRDKKPASDLADKAAHAPWASLSGWGREANFAAVEDTLEMVDRSGNADVYDLIGSSDALRLTRKFLSELDAPRSKETATLDARLKKLLRAGSDPKQPLFEMMHANWVVHRLLDGWDSPAFHPEPGSDDRRSQQMVPWTELKEADMVKDAVVLQAGLEALALLRKST